MTVEYRALKESERTECLDLWYTVWPSDNRGYFERYFYGDIEWLPYYTQVAVENDRLVSAVHICKRTVPCGDLLLTMGGIANVATLPDYRGKGYNTGCLKNAIGVMEADAMDFSLLFTGIHDYYGRLGYSKISRRSYHGAIKQAFSPPEHDVIVRPVEAGDLPAIREIYTEYNRSRPITVQRSDAYWRDWLKITPEKIPDHFYAALGNDSRVLGYARCGTFKSAVPYGPEEAGVRLTEFGVSDTQKNAQATTHALMEYVAKRFLETGSKNIRLDIAPEPDVLNALKNVVDEVEVSPSNSGMVRLLHRENLSRGISMQLNDRWIAAGRPRGSVSFSTPYGPISIEADGAFLLISPSNEADSLSQQIFFELLFGMISPEDATEDPALHSLLAGLFPRMASTYYGSDGF